MNLEIDNFNVDFQFASLVFRYNKPEYLSQVKQVFEEAIQQSIAERKPNDIYPGAMSGLLSQDERIEDFVKYVSDISWDVLNKQGYNMDLFYTDASEMWGQYHPRTSSMEKHSHGQGNFLTGFYFLDTPENSTQMCLHDPRAVKMYADLPLRESNELTPAHSLIYYTPQAGDIIFTNSWLEHSFSRNASDKPYNFIHINVRVYPRPMNNVEEPIIV